MAVEQRPPRVRRAVFGLAQHLQRWGAAVKCDEKNLKVTAVHGYVVQVAVLREGAQFGDPEGWWWYLVYPAPKHLDGPDYDRVEHLGGEEETAERICRILSLPFPKGAGV